MKAADLKRAIEPDVIVKGVATLRMFIAAHNTVRPADSVSGDELELLNDMADELEAFLSAYRLYREVAGKGGS